MSRLIGVTAPAGNTTYAYDAASNPITVEAANGSVSRFAYDSRNWLRDVHHTQGGTTLASMAYDLSATGRRLRATEADGSVETYGYDVLDRLVSEARRRPKTTLSNLRVRRGRQPKTRMVRDGVETTYSYDVDDKLLTAGVTSYGYDANGKSAFPDGR